MDPITGENPYDKFLPTYPPPSAEPAEPYVPENFDRFLPSDPPSTIGRARTALANLEKGAAAGVGNTLKFLARAGQAIGRTATPISPGLAPIILPDAVTQERNAQISPARREQMVQEDPLHVAGQVVIDANKDAWKSNPKYDNEFIPGLIPNTVGRMVPALATMNPWSAIFVGSADQAEAAAEEAVAAGRPDKADVTAALNFPVALASEALLGVPAQVLSGGRKVGETFLKQTLAGAAREGSQEGIEQVWQNLVAKHLSGYDPSRGYMDQVPESMLAGAVVGGGVSGLAHLMRPSPDVINVRDVAQPQPGVQAQPQRGIEYPMEWVNVEDTVEPINVRPAGFRLNSNPTGSATQDLPVLDGEVVPEDWQNLIDRSVAPTPRLSPALQIIQRQQAIIDSTPNPVKRGFIDVPLIERPEVAINDPDEPQPRLKFPITGEEQEFRFFPRVKIPQGRLMLPETTSEPTPEVYEPTVGARELLERIDRNTSRRSRVSSALAGTTVPPSGRPIILSETGINPGEARPGATLRYGMETMLPRARDLAPVDNGIIKSPEPAPSAAPVKKASAARAALAPPTPASPPKVQKSRVRAALIQSESQATAPAPAPAPATQPTSALSLAEEEIESMRIDPEATRAQAVRLARKFRKAGLITDNDLKEAVRVGSDRDMGAEDVLDSFSLNEFSQKKLAEAPLAQSAAPPAAPANKIGRASKALAGPSVKEEGGIKIIMPSAPAAAAKVTAPTPAVQAPPAAPAGSVTDAVVSSRADASRSFGRNRPIEDKSEASIAPLTKGQAAVLRSLGSAQKDPNSARARLVQFLGQDIQKYVDRAVALKASHVTNADQYVHAHLLQDAVEFYRDTKTFMVGPGGFAAQTIANSHATNALVQSKMEKSKATRGSASLNAELNPSEEGGDSPTLGEVLPSQAMNPAEQAADKERQAAVLGVMRNVMAELRGDYEKAGRGLAFDVVAAEVLGGVEVNRKKLPADQKKWVNDTAFHSRVIRDVRNSIARHAGSLDKFRAMLTERFSRTDANGDIVPISTEEISQAITEMAGSHPDNIIIIDDPTARTPDGEQWDARIRMRGGQFEIVLNRAFIGSQEQVKSLLMHEAVHSVSRNPEVQDAIAAVAATVNPNEAPGTTDEERFDEAIAESVTENWSSSERRSAWRKLVDTIWAAIKKLFGINPPASQAAQDTIVAAALQSLRGQVTNPGEETTLYSRVAGQRFRSVREVAKSINVPGLDTQRSTDIIEAGRAVGRLVSDTQRVAMDNLAAKGSSDVDQRAHRILRPVREIGQMALMGASPFAGNEDLQSRGVLDANQYLSKLNIQWRRKLESARQAFAKAISDLPLARAKDIEALVAESNAKQMVAGYRDYLKAERTLASKSGNATAAKLATLNAMESELGSVLRDQPASIRSTLEAIARHMPPGLTDEVALSGWLATEEKTGYPAFGGTPPATAKVWKFLVKGDATAGIAPAIVNTPGLMGRLADLRTIIDDATAAAATKARFVAHMTALGAKVRASVSAEQFAREYAKWVEARKGAADEANTIYSDLQRADLKVRSLYKAISHLDMVQADPQYRSELSIAADRLNQRTGGIISYSTVKGKGTQILDGKVNIVGPVSGETFQFDYEPTREAIDRNISNGSKLIGEVSAYLANPDAEPGRAAVYRERVLPMLRGRFMVDAASQLIGASDQPTIPLLSPHWTMKVPFRATETGLELLSHFFPGVAARKVVYNVVGGAAGADLLNYLQRTDIFHSAIKAVDHNPSTSSTTQKKLAIRAAQEHGFLPKARILKGSDGRAASEQILDWDTLVLNQLFARNQNPGGAGLRVGDFTPTGHQITAHDLAAANAQKGYTDGIRKRISSSASFANAQLPPQVREATAGMDDYFRDETNWGLKMARSVSHWGAEVSAKILEAAQKDDVASQAAGFQVHDAFIKLLEDNPTDANLLINGWWGTTNPEYWSTYRDQVQKAVAMELSSKPAVRHTFDDLDAFLNHFGQRRADRINAAAGSNVTSEVIQKGVALERFVSDIVSAAQKILGSDNGTNLPGRDAEGVGSTITDITTARSSLSDPRGKMVAPDPFYSYSITDEGQRLRFNSQVMMYAQSQELLNLRATLAGLRRALAKMDADYANSIPRGTGVRRLMNELQYKRSKSADVKAGLAITRRRDLAGIIAILENTADGMEANMKQANMSDKALMQMIRGAESTLSVDKLLSIPVQFANMLSAGYIVPALNGYAMGRGRMDVVNSLVQAMKMVPLNFKQFWRAISDVADSMGIGDAFRRNPDALMGIARFIHESALARREQMEYLRNAGFQVPETWGQAADRALMNFRLPETGGVVAREASLHPVINPIVSFARIFPGAMLDAMAFAGGQLTAHGEMIGTMMQDEANKRFIESLKPDIIRAFRERQRAVPGWDDTSKPMAPFHPRELGFNSHKAINELRRFFITAGTLENLFLDWYKRATAGGGINMDEPLLPDMQERAVRLEMQKAGNIVTDSGKGDALKKKGWAGVGTGILFRFQQYPLMLSRFINDKLSIDPRDASAANILRDNARAMMLLAVAGAMAIAGLAGRQWLQYLQSGKVPAQSTVTSFMQDPTAMNFSKMMVAGGANLFMPYWGDAANKLLSGQSQKPGFDLAQIVPGFGAAAQFGEAISQIAQTRSVGQPMIDLTRRLAPATESVLNRMPGLSQDLVVQNAARSIRSASPSDIELKPMGGGNARLTPTTPAIRSAIRAAVLGDRAAFDSSVDRAVQMKVEAGADPQSARQAVLSSIGGRNPIRTAVGRELTPDEETRMTAAMTGSQLAAYNQTKDTFARIQVWGGGGSRKTSRPGRRSRTRTGGVFGQSALRRGRGRGRRRRSPVSAALAR